jgi:hypothetical protein
MATNRATKKLKAEIFEFLASDAFKEWTVVFSSKSLAESSEHYGEVDLQAKIITINPRKPMIDCVSTLVHEILHILRPRSYEKTIYRWQGEIKKHLSPLEITSLLHAIFVSKVIWDE